MVGSGLIVVWFLFVLGMRQLLNLYSLMLQLSYVFDLDMYVWVKCFMVIVGVEEVVVIVEDKMVYLKVDKSWLD